MCILSKRMQKGQITVLANAKKSEDLSILAQRAVRAHIRFYVRVENLSGIVSPIWLTPFVENFARLLTSIVNNKQNRSSFQLQCAFLNLLLNVEVALLVQHTRILTSDPNSARHVNYEALKIFYSCDGLFLMKK